MPSYRAPGIFIEEIPSGSRPIVPVGTSTAAFIGTARRGPVNVATLVTNFAQFEKTFGPPYRITDSTRHYLAYAVRHFFEQGGTRCYIVRVAHYTDPNTASTLQAVAASVTLDGLAADNVTAVSPTLGVQAISPGVWGQDLTVRVIPTVRFSVLLGAAIPAAAATQISLAFNDQVERGSLLWIVQEVVGTVQSISATGAVTFNGPLMTGGAAFSGNVATGLTVFGPGLAYIGKTSQAGTVAVAAGVPGPTVDAIEVNPTTKLDGVTPIRAGDTLTIALAEARVVVDRVSVLAGSPPTTIANFASQTFATSFPVAGTRVYARDFSLQVSQRDPVTMKNVVVETHENLSLVNANLSDHVDLRLGPDSGASQFITAKDASGTADDTFLNNATQVLQNGDDGLTGLNDADFTGSELLKTGINALTPVRDAAILAIPNASFAVTKAAIAYCDLRGDLFLIIERPAGTRGDIRTYRASLSSKYAAIYHPWIKIPDPFTGQQLLAPPSGAVAGIYALTDARRGVHKAPAGLDTGKVTVATGLELKITKADYDVLYQEQINAIFALREGFHVWGSRTISADAQWLQVNVRRLFNFLEKSIENGTQWATFEPNDPTLWKSLERNISAFLRVQWLEGKLVGATETDAFFVHCNAETNPPEVVNAGQVVTMIGVAPSRPAEFVIFRIQQKVGGANG